jgi:plastocyanin domain-containing protein
MTSTQVAVTLAGLAGVAWVNWYFFLAGRGAAVSATPEAGGVQRVRVEVRGGYTPSVVRVRADAPVRLEFHRDETNPCTEEVVLPDFGIRTFLPPHRTTPVSFTPAAGTYEFACGMGMVRGTIIAEKRG